MSEERPLRADAERNRVRVIEAAESLFRERGLDVGVAEIAERAGVGRGTLFRNFASKEDLIAAIVVERMREVQTRGAALLDAADPVAALFQFLEEAVGLQQVDRPLFESVTDEFLANVEIRAAHTDVVETLDKLLTRAQDTGAVRDDVEAMDVLMLLKGVFEASAAFPHSGPDIVARYLDLVRAALRPSDDGEELRGRAPTLEDIERASGDPGAAARQPARAN